MLKDDNINNVYYKFYICQLKVSTPYSEFLPKVKAELNQLGEEVFNIGDSASKQKNQNDLSLPQNDIGRNLNYLAQTINQYENIDFERNADDNYMKHIIVYEQKFYSRVNILGIVFIATFLLLVDQYIFLLVALLGDIDTFNCLLLPTYKFNLVVLNVTFLTSMLLTGV